MNPRLGIIEKSLKAIVDVNACDVSTGYHRLSLGVIRLEAEKSSDISIISFRSPFICWKRFFFRK